MILNSRYQLPLNMIAAKANATGDLLIALNNLHLVLDAERTFRRETIKKDCAQRSDYDDEDAIEDKEINQLSGALKTMDDMQGWLENI
jgi:hypothetical protein